MTGAGRGATQEQHPQSNIRIGSILNTGAGRGGQVCSNTTPQQLDAAWCRKRGWMLSAEKTAGGLHTPSRGLHNPTGGLYNPVEEDDIPPMEDSTAPMEDYKAPLESYTASVEDCTAPAQWRALQPPSGGFWSSSSRVLQAHWRFL